MKAELIDVMGSDLTVVNAARVSFDKESEWSVKTDAEWVDGWTGDDRVLSEKDQKLISYLARNNHFTPCTHCVVTLRETVPIFVARQRFKHTVGFSYNEVSRRYVDDTPEFYTPMFRERAQNKKQGSGEEFDEEKQIWLRRDWRSAMGEMIKWYEHLLAAGVAPEQARAILPQSMMTSYYVTGSLYAFARAFKLRSDGHAQQEIQTLASEWDKLIRPLFPVSWEALTGQIA
jgi:thymidylate synthase (FAD)